MLVCSEIGHECGFRTGQFNLLPMCRLSASLVHAVYSACRQPAAHRVLACTLTPVPKHVLNHCLSPLQHIHVPRRQRSGLNRSPGSGDFQMVDAVLPEPAKSPLHRRNRSTASVGGASGDAPGRPSAILRVTDATGGGSVRRRVSGMPNGVARGVSAGSPRCVQHS